MDNFPYLITLFLFTMAAVMLYSAKTKRNADEAFERNEPSKVRMAAERPASAKIMADTLRERREGMANR